MELKLHELEFYASFLFFILFYLFYYFFFLNKFDHPILDFLQIEFYIETLKIEFQNRDISLISLGNWAKCWIFCAKEAKANFLR